MNSESTSASLADPYATLGVDRSADDEAIKRAYFARVREHPPEREPDRFREIRAAYDAIRTPDRRQRTNLFLLQPPPPLPARRAPTFDLTVHPSDVLILAFESILERFPAERDFHEPRLPE